MHARIYLDHNATTPLAPQAREAMRARLDEGDSLGNPSSPHRAGHRARILLEEAREEVAALIGLPASGLVFTSGGTEADNQAIVGRARWRERSIGRGSIVTSAIEHPAVLEPCALLESEGWRIVRVGVDGSGRVDPGAVAAACAADTALISVMAANNETGVLQPIAEIGRIARARGIPLHVDAVQAVPWGVLDAGIDVDALTLSAHKMGGPPGIGAIWMREDFGCEPLIRGGRQERGRRAGTEAVIAAAGFAAAARAAAGDTGRAARIGALRDRLERELIAIAPSSRVNGADAARLPNTTSLTIPGTDQEAIVIAMDLRGVAISTGSACSTGSSRPSHVLTAMGLAPDRMRSTVRWSLGPETGAEMIDAACEAFAAVIGGARATAVPASGEAV